MKISVNLDADTVNVRALNIGRIAVEIDGIALADLVDAVSSHGYLFRIADEPGKIIVEHPLPSVQCLPR